MLADSIITRYTCCMTLFCKLQDSVSTVMIMVVDSVE